MLFVQVEDIEEAVLSLVRGLVGQDVAQDQPFMEAGLDSLGAVELRNAVSAKYRLDLPATLLFDYPNAASLSSFLAASLGAVNLPLTGRMDSQMSGPQQATGAEVVAIACRYPDGPTGFTSTSAMRDSHQHLCNMLIDYDGFKFVHEGFVVQDSQNKGKALQHPKVQKIYPFAYSSNRRTQGLAKARVQQDCIVFHFDWALPASFECAELE